MAHEGNDILSLSNSLVSRVDVSRLALELESLTEELEQHRRRQTQSATLRVSNELNALASVNKLELSHADDRQRLVTFLAELKKSAPSIHISFAAEPSVSFVERLIEWLRSEIHPLLLLDIGLQPTIAAGCIIRTPSRYIDCSIRQHLQQSRPKLVELIRGTTHA